MYVMKLMAYLRSSVARILDNTGMNKVFVEMVDVLNNSATNISVYKHVVLSSL